ncbi:MAG: prolipoprotein diacylglyceryl transferase [Bacillota bacterium]
MHPVLFQIGGISIYSYGVMISLAILVAALVLFREAPREGINPDHVLEAIIVAAAAGLLGSRLLYVALNWELFSGRLLSIFFARFEGLSFYGAFFGGALALLIWGRRRKIDFYKMADLLAPYLALGYAFGRIGCFLNGCCYGEVSSVPWALPVSMADNLLRHPVQLYASFGAIIIFVLLKLLRPVRPFSGFNLLALAALYGLLRFTTEFFREEPAVWLGLTTAQLFSLGLTAAALLMILTVLAAGAKKSGRTSQK